MNGFKYYLCSNILVSKCIFNIILRLVECSKISIYLNLDFKKIIVSVTKSLNNSVKSCRFIFAPSWRNMVLQSTPLHEYMQIRSSCPDLYKISFVINPILELCSSIQNNLDLGYFSLKLFVDVTKLHCVLYSVQPTTVSVL